jgi:predicted nucleic acid-binding Zn ribbon protein
LPGSATACPVAAALVGDLADFRSAEVDEATIALLREAEARIRHLRRQAEDQLAGAEPRPCARCSWPVTGRADRRFCSDRCRKAAHRRRPAMRVAAATGVVLAASSGVTMVTLAAREPVSEAKVYRSVTELYRSAQLPGGDHDQPEPDGAYAIDYVDNLGTAPVFVNVVGRPGWNAAGAALTMKWPSPRPDLPGPRFGWEAS